MTESSMVQGRRGTVVLALLAVTVLVVVMDITIVNVALDRIQQGLRASNADLQWTVDAYIVTFAAFLLTGGVAADRFGGNWGLIGGLVIFGTGSACSSFAGSVTALVAWRLVMGVGASVVPTVTLSLIVQLFPPAARPRAIAVWAAAAGVAFALGPVAGGLLLAHFWWGSIFLVNVPFVLVAVVLILWVLPGPPAGHRLRPDPIGPVLSVAGCGTLVYGIIEGGNATTWWQPVPSSPGRTARSSRSRTPVAWPPSRWPPAPSAWTWSGSTGGPD